MPSLGRLLQASAHLLPWRPPLPPPTHTCAGAGVGARQGARQRHVVQLARQHHAAGDARGDARGRDEGRAGQRQRALVSMRCGMRPASRLGSTTAQGHTCTHTHVAAPCGWRPRQCMRGMVGAGEKGARRVTHICRAPQRGATPHACPHGDCSARSCVRAAAPVVRRHNAKTGEFSWINPSYHSRWRELKDDSEWPPTHSARTAIWRGRALHACADACRQRRKPHAGVRMHAPQSAGWRGDHAALARMTAP